MKHTPNDTKPDTRPRLPVTVVGAGGHAKVVISALRAAGYDVARVLDDDERRWGGDLLAAPITGGVARLADHADEPAVLAIGSNRARQEIAARFPAVGWQRVIHPTAVVDPTVTIAPGAMVMAGAVIQCDAVIGTHAIVNTAASVDHDCVIGAFVHLAPGCRLAGNVAVGEGAMLGLGSKVLPGIAVGAWATLGAGAVAIRDVPAGVTAVGMPARVISNKPTAAFDTAAPEQEE